MTSSNHFRGRRLSRGAVAPISPRVEVPSRAEGAGQLLAVYIYGSLVATNSISTLTIASLPTNFYRTDDFDYESPFVSEENFQGYAQVTWSQASAFLSVAIFADVGGGNELITGKEDSLYDSRVPYTSKSLVWANETSWTPLSGSVVIQLPAAQTPFP